MAELPTWTILIPTIGQRADSFARLLDVLLPQLGPEAGRVRVLAWWNNGDPPLWQIRDALIGAASSEYVSFIDDDDLVPEYYVAEVVRALETRQDHVGFQLEYWVDGELKELVDHSIRHGSWGRGPDGLYRDLTHIDPVRTDLARRASFRVRRPGKAEDRMWVKGVRRHVRTEVYIDKVMYHYLWSPAGSAWRQPDLIRQGFARPVVDHPYFAWHPESADA